jgi:diadenylate cyclase
MNQKSIEQLLDAVTMRDLIEIGILTVLIYAVLRLLSKTRGSGIVRGVGLLTVAVFLAARVAIASFGLVELGRILDYLRTGLLVGLLIVFQPELRRGLILLGRFQALRYLTRASHPIADHLVDAVEALSRQGIGALIAIQREVALAPYIETGERLDGVVSASLIRTIFSPRSPLHDGALILCGDRIAAAACQLPLGQPPNGASPHMGMRHRAALSLSEETDAVLLVVSEETGRISLGVRGRLEAVSCEALSRRLIGLLSPGPETEPGVRRAA